MNYTEGATKVFRVLDNSLGFHESKVLAHQAGYKALSFNGEIWIRFDRKWHLTPFLISDFVVE